VSDGGALSGAQRRLRYALVGVLVATTFGQRFGLNFGSYSLNAALPAMYGFMFLAVLSRALLISRRRLLAYGACVCVGTLSVTLNAETASTPSLLLMLVMYAPFLCTLCPAALGAGGQAFALQAFSSISMLCALAGIAQFYAQYVVKAPWLFDFTPYVPSVLRGPSGYNTVIAVGSHYKSNGFFFHEPSDFSFVMALGLIVEWVGQKRPLRLGCHALALLLTYSGTGIFALAIGLLFPLGLKTLARISAGLLLAAFAFYALDDVLNLSFTLARAGEFGSERSSAYIRYIAPLRLISDSFDAGSASAWLGHGPGTIFSAKPGYAFHDPTWAKILYEYGTLGFAAFVALFATALARPQVPPEIRAMLFGSWLLLGGRLLSPEHNYLTLALVTLVPLTRRARGAELWMPSTQGAVATPPFPRAVA